MTPSARPAPGRLLPAKWRSLALLALAELFAMTMWFSASAVVPQLELEWALTDGVKSWLTMSVQIGFVVGALLSAVLNLADRIPVRTLITMSALLGAAFNACLVVAPAGAAGLIALRFLTGMTLAGVYPPGMKLVVTWCREDRGLGIGFLIGALAIGSGLPHLLNGFPGIGDGGMPPWRTVVLTTSGLAVAGAFIVGLCVRTGPYHGETAPFNWSFAASALRHRPTRLANYGYLGHMWELYAMWTWVPIFLIASFELAGYPLRMARLAGFAVIAVGAAGCVLAGLFADRIGRTTVASASLALSGVCALLAGFFFAHPVVLTVICLVWGFAVVADSAQFSAAVSELTDPRYVGTALTVQTSLGFLLTLLTIYVVPPIVDAFGWRYVFIVLAPGPIFGIWSMLRLRVMPEATRMANGNR